MQGVYQVFSQPLDRAIFSSNANENGIPIASSIILTSGNGTIDQDKGKVSFSSCRENWLTLDLGREVEVSVMKLDFASEFIRGKYTAIGWTDDESQTTPLYFRVENTSLPSRTPLIVKNLKTFCRFVQVVFYRHFSPEIFDLSLLPGSYRP